MRVNSLLCIDLKTKLQDEVLMRPGKEYIGLLRRDEPTEDYGFDDSHYTFIETLHPAASKRNPYLYKGRHFTITRKDDNTLRLNFRPMRIGGNFSIDSYSLDVCNELRQALTGLLEE